MTELLKFLIVDDEEIDRLFIECEAEKFPFLKMVASCAHPLLASELIHKFQPDILFVDIEMPDISGIQLVKMSSKKGMLPVFITSHAEFALESYELEAFDFLLKPVSSERFARCSMRLHDFFQLRDKAYAFDKNQETDSIIIKQGYEKHRLNLRDILYVEAMRDYTRIMTISKHYLVLMPLSGMLEKLLSKNFIRIHRSYVVNLDKINEVRGTKLLIGNYELPIGKLFKNCLSGKF